MLRRSPVDRGPGRFGRGAMDSARTSVPTSPIRSFPAITGSEQWEPEDNCFDGASPC